MGILVADIFTSLGDLFVIEEELDTIGALKDMAFSFTRLYHLSVPHLPHKHVILFLSYVNHMTEAEYKERNSKSFE